MPISPLPRLAHLTGLSLQIIVFKLGCSTSQASSNHEVVCCKNNFCSHITLLLRMLRAISLLHHGHSACITKTSQNDPWFVGTSDILSLHNHSSVGFNVFRYKIRIINASRFGAHLCLRTHRCEECEVHLEWMHMMVRSSHILPPQKSIIMSAKCFVAMFIAGSCSNSAFRFSPL